MSTLVFDIEANGLLDELREIYCLSIYTHESRIMRSYYDGSPHGTVLDGIEELCRAETIAGHNIIGYDIPAIKKLYGIDLSDRNLLDTLVLTGLAYPGDDLKQRDYQNHKVPGGMKGRRSLESWGYRLGFPKIDFSDFSGLTPQMIAYCENDVLLSDRVLTLLEQKNLSPLSVDIEHKFYRCLSEMMRAGVHVDINALDRLTQILQAAQAEAADRLQKFFPPVYQPEILETDETLQARKDSSKSPARLRRKTLQKEGHVVFNPGSRQQIAARLSKDYGWEPVEFTPSGLPKVDESCLSDLPYDCIPALLEYLMVSKKLGQVATGDNSWINSIQKDGKIYGYVNHQGTVTSRCAHSHPNLGQVPRVGKPFGAECRAVFIPKPGWVLTGCDAAGLELRMLGHFTTEFDGGAFRDSVMSGDPHTDNMKALGLTNRDLTKTWFYAWLYGATDKKLATVLGCSAKEAAAKRALFESRVPGLGLLKLHLEKDLVSRGQASYNLKWGKQNLCLGKRAHLLGLDGRVVPCRSPHSLLNAYNQSAGAVLVKMATVLFRENMGDLPYNMVLHVHDEFQVEHPPEIGEKVRRIARDSFVLAGEKLGLRCPMDGDPKTGKNWSETH
jgi:DNA polymerase-1